MSAFCSIMMLGNSIDLFDMFLGFVLLVLGCVFFITGDGYDMRNDVIVSIKGKCNEHEERIIKSKKPEENVSAVEG